MSVWKAGLILFYSDKRQLLSLAMLNVALVLMAASQEPSLAVFFFLVIVGGVQGARLRASAATETSFMLPRFHVVKLIQVFYYSVLAVLPAAFLTGKHYELGFTQGVAQFGLFFYLALGSAFYRNGILTTVLILVAVASMIGISPALNAVLIQVSLLAPVVNMLVCAGIMALIYRAMRSQEFGDKVVSHLYNHDQVIVNLSGEVRSGEASPFLGGRILVSETVSRLLNKSELMRSILGRFAAVYGDAATMPLVLALVETLVIIVLVAVARLVRVDNSILMILLLLPMLVIVMPFVNELSDCRKRIPGFCLRNSLSFRRESMKQIAYDQIVRIAFALLMWVLLISTGFLLVDQQESWWQLYFLVIAYLPACIALCFTNGIMNRSGSMIVNNVFILVHSGVIVCCFLLALFMPYQAILFSAIVGILAVVAVRQWWVQDIELC